MTKADLLKLLAEEYKKTVRLPDDISLKDYQEIIERETNLKISDKRATRALNSLKGFTSLIVVERGKVIRVWRKDKHDKTRNTHKPTRKRTGGVSKKGEGSKLASSVPVRSGQ